MDFILSKLQPFLNTQRVLVQNQTVSKIKNGILNWQAKYASEYDKIYKYFLGATPKESARNVFDFLKNYVDFKIESDDLQTLRTPSAVIAPGKTMGADCKSFALFSAGVLEAISRNTNQKIPLAFRFASYDLFSAIPKHVFTVMYPGTDKEIWVDPVLNYFDEKMQPTFYTDKKINPMALVAMAGIGEAPNADQIYNGMIDERSKLMQRGYIKSGDPLYNKYTQLINMYADRVGKPRIGNAKIGLVWETLISYIPAVINMFSQQDNSQAWQTTPSKDDWGWWLVKDPSNHPANNFIVYFSKHPDFLTVGLKNNPDTGFPYTIAQKQQIMKDRLTAAGYPQINALLNAWNTLYNIVDGSPKSQSTGTPALPGAPATTSAGMNMWVTVALVGAGIYAVTKMKK